MSRPIASLWPYLWRPALLLVIVVAASLLLQDFATIYLACLVWCVAWVNFWKHDRWLCRLMRHVRHFRTACNERLVLHYEPSMDDAKMSSLLRRCQRELDRLAVQFGKP